MRLGTETFKENAEAALLNEGLQQRLHVLEGITEKRHKAFSELPDGEVLRDRARSIKEEVILNLDRYLLRLEENVQRAGGMVHWARDAEEARVIILELASKNGVQRVVKGKSMASEEIGLNEALELAGIEAVETDLGEYIIQLSEETPSHIIVPAIHKSKEDISELFADKLDAGYLREAGELTRFAREKLREKFCTATMGITGANFAVADTGTVVLVENEGNIRLSTTLPLIHVALMGIEKVIPTLRDLNVFLQVLARSATGQKMTTYVSLLTGPRRKSETDGAEQFHLVLLDNGRTRILQDKEKRESLYCLRCGACLNVCPVYTKIGGHAYGSVYPGPIGSIITPPLVGLQKSKDLPFASSLCGACREVCPVKIDIPQVLLRLRNEWVEGQEGKSGGSAPFTERAAMRLWSFAMSHQRVYNLAFRLSSLLQLPLLKDGKIKRLPFALGGWTVNRDFPAVARRSFHSLWRDIE
ncbi:MAG: iron-sulfur cluster-binding protein [Acidobacteria bacterium]|nr:iron-sulfur cluster-binding protein [Acidobacteriota bacterium]